MPVAAHAVPGPVHLGSHTSPVSLGFGVLIALFLLVLPGAIVARVGRLTWPTAVAVGPALTYGVVALSIVPFGALGVPWNAWTALFALAVVTGTALGVRVALRRVRDVGAEARAATRGPALVVAAGVLLGGLLIGLAALRGMPNWQSIPSNWDSVWHANTIRFILDTGQASPTHMGELRNVETHEALYYPSTFHALAAIFSQLTGAAPATAYTLNSLAAAIWLFPVSAATLTWRLLRSRTDEWRTAGAAATAAGLSASFTAIPYVEFDTASMPNLAAFGVAVPTMVLVVSALRHRDRIPLAVLALLGVFSVHITGGVVVVLFVAAWWLVDALWHPVRGRLADLVDLLLIAIPTVALLLPQFLGVWQQAEIIAGHAFVTHEGKKRGLIDAVVQHTRHLNDFPVQWVLIILAAIGAVVLLVRRIWWPLAVWLLLVVSIVHSSAPFGGPIGAVVGKFSNLFYSDPRRLSAVVTMLLTAAVGIAVFTLASAAVAGGRRLVGKGSPRAWHATTAAIVVAVSVGIGLAYLPRDQFLFGEKYDRVLVDAKDLEAWAYLATLPGAHDTLIGDANTDGTSWMYAVADLHPLWTHYDFPVQQGPGYHRFIFWAYAHDADTDPRVAEAVKALNIRYVVTSTPVVRGFVMPDGLVSLDRSRSWKKIYDNGEARIYEWRGEGT
ncbi:MAG: D-galactosaminyltransferase [Mycobacterium sp.]|nr:D-galactosaminyltransferase [Mycobacterium sp.]